jgi:D-galactarolactone cycloisomerase
MPVYKLLGGYKDKIKAYLTCVWTGKPDQSDIAPEEQAEQALIYLSHGYKGMKIRAWRPDPMDDVKAVREIKKAVGDKMEIMIDRTAQFPGWIWDYGTAYRFAREIEALGATWLEEPFYRGDIYESARLAEVVDIPITGGEGDRGLAKFRDYLVNGSLDIVQPDAYGSGGIMTIKKIGAMAEAFGKECIMHGSNGFGLMAGLQVSAAMPNCRMMEIALIHPPLLPEQHWESANEFLKNPPLFEVEDGYIKIPDKPGLGIELKEELLR